MPQPSLLTDVETIFRQHHAWLRGRLMLRASSHSEAEDVASETFLQLTEKGRSAEGEMLDIRHPRALLSTIAKRILIKLWQRQDLEAAYESTLRHMPEAMALSPEMHAMLVEAICQIDRALAALPLPVKTVFLLSRLEGMRYPQIAEHMGISLATVERHMRRALLQCLRCAP
ncbi:MAG: sigma-70 family RNA polymerase sigma factor [Comamonas sp.]|jgi:RNA polymerase sigma-70 factor (ECF subfamily)|nr:sigma-70 family RNA polymerase sigma factor [Comamonas sp.]